MLQGPVCKGRRETTVWAHSNKLADGKGIGRKADDDSGCFACFECHTWYDNGPATRAEKDAAFAIGHRRSIALLQRRGQSIL